jgi:preprotein translocase subunit SecD
MVLLTTALAAAELLENQTRTLRFEMRLASYEKVEGWENVPGPAPGKVNIWISPETTLTNADVAQAWPDRMDDKFCVGLLLTEEGALKLARLSKAHIGEFVALIIDGRVMSVPKIMAEINGGRAVLSGKFTEEEAGSIAEGITRQ